MKIRSAPIWALAGASNGLNPYDIKITSKILALTQYLESLGFLVQQEASLWAPISNPEDEREAAISPRERAVILQNLFVDPNIRGILDPTGGDLANEILSYLDWDLLRRYPKPYFGFSDNSVTANALHFFSNTPVHLFQPLNLVGPESAQPRFHWESYLQGRPFIAPPVKNLRGQIPLAPAAGGNIRCMLKLAGTRWWHDFSGKIVILESWGGDGAFLRSHFAHLEQLGVFDQAVGILLGTFSKMENSCEKPTINDKILEMTQRYQLPIAKASWIGHGADAIPVPFGPSLRLIGE